MTPKLRLVFYEDEKGIQSYFHLEKTERLRVIAILKILPELKNWTPVSEIAERIKAKIPATLWTIQKLAGALWIDLKIDGKRKVIAKRPILLVRKEQHNTRNNLRKQKYLRASVYMKRHSRK